MRLSPDDRAFVTDVFPGGGHSLLEQPFDGTPAHMLFNPAPEIPVDFGWSPSGKQLAVERLKLSSDVVLITDEEGKETH
jgi:hypothetical protein